MVIIESVIKSNPLGRWYIELTDTMKEEGEDRVICLDINEYAQKIEMMGEEYGNAVEVAWSSDDGVTVEQINEVRMQIMAYEAEVEAKKQEATHMPDGTPNFNA
jgi:flagellar biosynthesis chaperone FliJ